MHRQTVRKFLGLPMLFVRLHLTHRQTVKTTGERRYVKGLSKKNS